MVFVSIGMQNYKFDRLFDYLEHIDDQVIIQCGDNNVNKKDNYTIYKYLSVDEIKKYIDQCDLFISHGGPSNIMYALSKNKKVIVVPRMEKYNEHINDHQVVFANYLKDNKYAYVAESEDEFIKCLKSNKKIEKYNSNTSNFIKSIGLEIDQLLGE